MRSNSPKLSAHASLTSLTSRASRTSRKRGLASAAVLLLGAMALTACQPSASASTSAGTAAPNPSQSQQATGGGASSGTSASPVSAPTQTTSTGGSNGSGSTASSGPSGSTGGSSAGSAGGGSSDTDSYAWTHPCSASQLTVHLVTRAGAPRLRVIEVHNFGAHACGLSYFPLVSLDNAHSADDSNAVKPLVPGGLGGPPAYPVLSGRTAYAVIDLDPSGATSGTVAGINELNVLADGDHMPNADTINFPISTSARVLAPKLGLYEASVSAAVASMESANTPSW